MTVFIMYAHSHAFAADEHSERAKQLNYVICRERESECVRVCVYVERRERKREIDGN